MPISGWVSYRVLYDHVISNPNDCVRVGINNTFMKTKNTSEEVVSKAIIQSAALEKKAKTSPLTTEEYGDLKRLRIVIESFRLKLAELDKYEALKRFAVDLSRAEGEDLKHNLNRLVQQDEVSKNTVIEMLSLPEESKESIEDYVKVWRTTFPASLVKKISSRKLLENMDF